MLATTFDPERAEGDECIAVKRDLWFEGSIPADARQAPDPWHKPVSRRQRQAGAVVLRTRRSWRWHRAAPRGECPPWVKERGDEKLMPVLSRLTTSALTVGALVATASVALAGVGHPTPWELGLQGAASPVMVDITRFHDFLLWLITGIALFVLVLLGVVVVRFNARANPTPSRTTHNSVLEVAWTIVPVIILVSIAVPSFRLLFVQLDVPKPDLTVKATGKQWYWSYNYPDNGNFEFDSLLVEDKDLKPGQPRLLTVDNEMVVPVNKIVHVLVTGADVIHSFNVPSFGVRIDAIPGRLNETWFKATSEGLFHGQCSELCGKDHAFMPIVVRVVNDAEFATWVAAEKKNAGLDSAPPTAFAATGAPNR
jgi:cytochrome c oxidase subunit II